MWHAIKVEKKPFVGEVQNKRKDGALYWQELHISPVLDREGTVRFFIGIEPNITDRKEKEKFREEFISIIGHQLRNPLLSIRWAIELLFRNGRLNEEDKKNLEAVYKENLSLADFVGDLLVLSRAGAGAPAETTFDLAQEIEKIIADVTVHHPRVKFSFRTEEHRFPLTADKSLALQVFSNILYNAAEYSEKDAGKVAVTLEDRGSAYYFSSENNGPPILAHDRPKIFSKLFRASNAAEMKEHGTGLGLFLVKMICGVFGWEVSFKSPASANGTGTIFFIHIPIHRT